MAQLQVNTLGGARHDAFWQNGTRRCSASDIDGSAGYDSWWRNNIQRRYHSAIVQFMGTEKFVTAVMDDYGTLVEVRYEIAA